MATALAAAGLASRIKRGEGGLLQQGTKLIGSSPELQELTKSLRGELMEAGKAAAVAATSRQIQSLSSRLLDRTESLRQPGATDSASGDEETYEDGVFEDEAYEEEPPKAPPKKAPPKKEPPKKEPPKAAARTRRERPARPVAKTTRGSR
ncbi:hypothetical protein [Nonomuraea roseola]|uniref:Uncharacterized protein n=1 Tax=Nonomuraea roseola TaxID=46179 RepID=A0ABV5Q5M6_9ACTN